MPLLLISMCRRLAFLLVLLLAAVLAPPAAQAKPLLGIADQKPWTFDDPQFQALGLRDARMNVPWDVLQDPNTLPMTDAWMAGAKRDGIRPLLTIDRSRRPGRQAVNPTTTQLFNAVKAWRKRWPGQVRQISTWNEGNINKRPELVAKWWLAVRRACVGCTVLGADLVDRSNAASWAQRFIRTAKRTPRIWGLHAYNDANTFKTVSTRAFLKGVAGEVWLTETGGVLNRRCPRYPFAGKGEQHAARATSFLLRQMTNIAPTRITRIYLYSWGSGEGDLSWDSGLVGPDLKPRKALAVVRRWLGLPPTAAVTGGAASTLTAPAFATAQTPGATTCAAPLKLARR